MENIDLAGGDNLFLANGWVSWSELAGEFEYRGSMKEVWLNGQRLTHSRWGRTSIEIRSTLVAALLGAFGAFAGGAFRKKKAV